MKTNEKKQKTDESMKRREKQSMILDEDPYFHFWS